MKHLTKFALVFMILGAFIWTSCSNALSPAASAKGHGQGLTIKVSDSGVASARTLYPKEVFSKYVLSFEGPSITSHDDIELANGVSSIDVQLMEGEWTVTACAYVTIGGVDYLAAEGSANVNIPDDSRMDIKVYAKQTAGEKGFFSYSVEYPGDLGVDSAGLWIYKFDADEPAVPAVNLLDDLEGTLELDPGFYIMIIRLENEFQAAVRHEIVHIYSGMETADDNGYVFTSGDFSGVIAVGGKVGININFDPAEQTLVIVRLADGSYIDESEVNEDGEWSARFLDPETDIIVEFTASTGNVKFSERTAAIDIKTASNLEDINLLNKYVSAQFQPPIAYSIGSSLNVGTPTVSGSVGALSYQWQADGVDISGARAASYTIAGAAAGKVISCNIIYAAGVVTVTGETAKYNITINRVSAAGADSMSFTETPTNTWSATGLAGDKISLYYNIANTAKFNGVHFSGLDSVQIESVLCADNTGDSGVIEYVVDDADANANGVITIITTFEHVALLRDPIFFEIEQTGIGKVYGDAPFANAITDAHSGEGAITYSCSPTGIVAVDADGVVTILKQGTVTIRADKAADETYGASSASYTLTVARKPLTVSGMTAENKVYDGNVNVLEYSDITLPAVVGVINDDDAYIMLDTSGSSAPRFADRNAGEDIAVIFTFILLGDDSSNYQIASPATNVTANITKKPVTITGMTVANKPYDGTTEAVVNSALTNDRIPEKVGSDNVYPANGSAEFASVNPANGIVVTFKDWELAGPAADNYELLAQPANTAANILKGDPTVIWPAGFTTVYGNTLGTIDLSEFDNAASGGTPGEAFEWVSPATATGTADGSGRQVGIQLHQMRFTPYDTTRYNVVTANVEIRVTLGVEMVPISVGNFIMGSADTADTGAQPAHLVVITRAFNMGKYPVTRRQYQAVMGAMPATPPAQAEVAAGNNANNVSIGPVSWYGALVYCNRLSMAEGLTPAYSISGSTNPSSWGAVPTAANATWDAVVVVAGSTGYRLPTEAQWEYACRAGTTTAYWNGDTLNTNTGWYNGNSGSILHDTANAKGPNAWGLYDMAGNVREWCWDWNGTYPSGQQIDPTGATSGTYRVHRGGAYNHTDLQVRSAYRLAYFPYARNANYYGFRLVRP